MPLQTFCPVLRVETVCPFAFALTLESEALAAAAQPGQFLHIKCADNLLLRRPISICSVENNCLTIVFEVRGAGTRWLSQRKPGDMLDLLGPLGRGFDLSGRKLLLAGGGIGVPPMLYAAQSCQGEVHAVLGFRSAERAILLEPFQAACQSVDIASDDGSIGRHAQVDVLIREKLEQEGDFTDVLACGPRPMLQAAAQAARQYGVPCQVSMEERMGCGVGACLVCACQMSDGSRKHVCKDGPVFRAEEVDWSE